jgi:NADH-quinone oxidoreductase subunit K
VSAISTPTIMAVAAVLFALGALGFLIRRNLIVVFMCIELMLNAANLTFLAVARERGLEVEGQVYTMFSILIAAAEAAVGLAIIIALFRLKASVDVDSAEELRG